MVSGNKMTGLGILAALGLMVSQYYIFQYAPTEQTMGDIQRIFYFHLPLAWWGMFSFFMVFLASIMVLIRKSHTWDLLAGGAAEIGLLFSGLAVISGSMWAKQAWNTWWTWDPRLSTALVMWFVYAGYLVLRASSFEQGQKQKLSAVLGIIAFLDIPLVFFSARLWRSIHPAVFASRGGGLEPEMLTTLLISLGAWGIFWVWLLLFRWNQLRMQSKVDGLLFNRNM